MPKKRAYIQLKSLTYSKDQSIKLLAVLDGSVNIVSLLQGSQVDLFIGQVDYKKKGSRPCSCHEGTTKDESWRKAVLEGDHATAGGGCPVLHHGGCWNMIHHLSTDE